jgi:hypothetical protein
VKRPQKVLISMALSLVVVAAGLVAATAPAQAVATASRLSDFRLRPATNQAELMKRVLGLDKKLPKLGVANILKQAPRDGNVWKGGIPCNPHAVPSTVTLNTTICFRPDDAGTRGKTEWTPQGVASAADAHLSQDWNGTHPVLVSWYNDNSEQTKGCRVSFINPDNGRYAHVLLAYPTATGGYMSLRTKQVRANRHSLHCGGMAWYGRYLYMADTDRGFRVFDMSYIFDLKAASNGNTSKKTKMGYSKGKYYAHGYRWVMPEVAAFTSVKARPTVKSKKRCTVRDGSPAFSYAAVDRTGSDHLVMGEFCPAKDKNGSPITNPNNWGRVASWPMDGNSGKPRIANSAWVEGSWVPSGGPWQADSAFRLPHGNIQGAVRYNHRWYLSQSVGKKTLGYLYTSKPVSAATGTLVEDKDKRTRAGIGPEDLSYWPGSNAAYSGIWTVTEHPGKRMLYNTPLP